MKKIEAIWEKENIGSNVLEIAIEKEDSVQNLCLDSIPSDYDYIVIKVPVNKVDFNWELGKNGYTMIETQVKLSMELKDLNVNDRFIKRLLPDVSYNIVTIKEDLDAILGRITPQMFQTDRVTLDPIYGPEIGCKRYKNYIRTSFDRKSSELIGIYFKDILIGFEMYNVEEDLCYGKLGGIFSDVVVPGLGFLVICSPLLFTSERYGVTKFIPDISTNNIPVVGLYEYLHFHIEDMSYVFVKHQ